MQLSYNFIEVSVGKQRDLEPVAALLRDQVSRRCGSYIAYHKTQERTPLLIDLVIDPALGEETYRLEHTDIGIRIAGGDRRGVRFGVGRFLRTSQYRTGWFSPGSWQGEDRPKRQRRGIYFATHAGNYFLRAPLSKVSDYLSELALWGTNSFAVWFCLHDFESTEDPAALAAVERLRALCQAAHQADMSVTLILMANEGFADTPEPLRAERSTEHGYRQWPIAWFPGQICPNAPGGTELILKNRQAMLQVFDQVPIDGFIIWPYDQGGCTCEQCAPWGSRAFLDLAPKVADLCQHHRPDAELFLSTWCFDKWVAGEYQGLQDRLLAGDLHWLDGIMTEDHKGEAATFLKSLRENTHLQVIGFPEISMYKTEPWGGYGAIACPSACQQTWDRVKAFSAGGFPYSEGPFEDVNKAIYARLYWDDQPAEETLHEYAAFEFGPEAADDIKRLLQLLEQSLPRDLVGKELPIHYQIKKPEAAAEAWRLAQKIQEQLPRATRRSWRWRLIYLRALVDHELVTHDGLVSERCEDVLNELTDLYWFDWRSNYAMNPQRIIRHGKPMERRLNPPS